MKIRLIKKDEIKAIVDIWYRVSLRAHYFISEKFWANQKNDMIEKYIPMSKTYVLVFENNIIGFISMLQDYLAALFISDAYHNKGYGKKLLDFVKLKHNYIELKVYKKNIKAYNFYLKNNFKIKNEQVDKLTNEFEYFMTWRKNKF